MKANRMAANAKGFLGFLNQNDPGIKASSREELLGKRGGGARRPRGKVAISRDPLRKTRFLQVKRR